MMMDDECLDKMNVLLLIVVMLIITMIQITSITKELLACHDISELNYHKKMNIYIF